MTFFEASTGHNDFFDAKNFGSSQNRSQIRLDYDDTTTTLARKISMKEDKTLKMNLVLLFATIETSKDRVCEIGTNVDQLERHFTLHEMA